MKLINWTPNINVNNVFDELDFFMNSFNSKNNSNNTKKYIKNVLKVHKKHIVIEVYFSSTHHFYWIKS